MQSVGVIRQLRRYRVKSNPHAISAPARDPSSSVLNSEYNLRGRAFSIANSERARYILRLPRLSNSPLPLRFPDQTNVHLIRSAISPPSTRRLNVRLC